MLKDSVDIFACNFYGNKQFSDINRLTFHFTHVQDKRNLSIITLQELYLLRYIFYMIRKQKIFISCLNQASCEFNPVSVEII